MHWTPTYSVPWHSPGFHHRSAPIRLSGSQHLGMQRAAYSRYPCRCTHATLDAWQEAADVKFKKSSHQFWRRSLGISVGESGACPSSSYAHRAATKSGLVDLIYSRTNKEPWLCNVNESHHGVLTSRNITRCCES